MSWWSSIRLASALADVGHFAFQFVRLEVLVAIGSIATRVAHLVGFCQHDRGLEWWPLGRRDGVSVFELLILKSKKAANIDFK